MHWLATRHCCSYFEHTILSDLSTYCIYFDGSVSSHGAGGGSVLFGARSLCNDDENSWLRVSELSFSLSPKATVTVAELEAALRSVMYLCSRLQGRSSLAQHLESWQPLCTARFPILEVSGLI